MSLIELNYLSLFTDTNICDTIWEELIEIIAYSIPYDVFSLFQ